MRVATKKDSIIKIKVYEHIILRNFWEYYLLDNKDGDIRNAFVMGAENEFGDVSIEEIRPYIISRIKVNDASELMPPTGFGWDEKNETSS